MLCCVVLCCVVLCCVVLCFVMFSSVCVCEVGTFGKISDWQP